MLDDKNVPEKATDLNDADLHTSTRYDPLLGDGPVDATGSTEKSPFYMLKFHYDRILEAADFLDWTIVKKVLPDTAALEKLLIDDIKVQNIGQNPTKIRFAINRHGKFSIGYLTLPPVPIETLFPTQLSLEPPSLSHGFTKVYIDTRFSSTGPSTTFKTTHRAVYDSARERFKDALGPGGLGGEVLVVDPSDEILEGTITSVYFFRDGRWVTPPVAVGPKIWKGHKGTTRRWALERGLCIEKSVMKDSVEEGEVVWLSNGARGFWVGRIVSLN
ncbi:hypothetical protein P280DRAFT_418803 [Massarina eburnea CBS 473.64]|uniref:D-aminoacid aminotransferase-like PLP-dependent enzyme n=1 Tax=Massarina eburnea CBS 473.64 TaxID=1395130 RepID=A0A6A6SBN0_9PLEO|nr:hypothetical protein P280DRAFT_418803 [Massarina eburnea CBS 473.64]